MPVIVDGQPLRGFVDIDFSDTSISITLTRDQTFGYFDLLRFADADVCRHVAIRERQRHAWSVGLRRAQSRDELQRLHGLADPSNSDTLDLNLTSLHGEQRQRILLDVGATPTATRR